MVGCERLGVKGLKGLAFEKRIFNDEGLVRVGLWINDTELRANREQRSVDRLSSDAKGPT